MSTRILFRAIMICVLFAAVVALAEDKATDSEKAASKKGWDEAWSWGNAFVVKNYFDQIYYPHSVALIDAEQKLSTGSKPAQILETLKSLPGIDGVVVLSEAGDAQWPDSTVNLRALSSILFNSATAQKGKTLSPMTHRTVGGKVKYQQVPLGDKWLDLYIRYGHSETTPDLPTDAVMLLMDRKWLMDRIPAAMDSLYRENSQLLFCAESPTNHLWEQSLGVVSKKDTLWWVGRKDVKITNVQPLWPFPGVEVYSYVHTLEKK